MFDLIVGAILILVFTLFLWASKAFANLGAEDRAAIDAQKDGTDEENTRESLHYLPSYVHEKYLEHYKFYKGKD